MNSSQKKSFVVTLIELQAIVEKLFALKDQCTIYTFSGPLGSGKTTLVKSLLDRFGVHETITSPTFAYMNKYTNDQKETLYHFDLYRLKDISEFLAAGFDEYLHEKNSWVFIEWPEIIMPLLQNKKVCKVTLNYVFEQDKRSIEYEIR